MLRLSLATSCKGSGVSAAINWRHLEIGFSLAWQELCETEHWITAENAPHMKTEVPELWKIHLS
jgi:hypothetical protein